MSARDDLLAYGAQRQAVHDAQLNDPHAARLRGVQMASARDAAVLVLFGALDEYSADPSDCAPADVDVLLVQRARTLGKHPGQVAFPGGAVDPDDDGVTAAALREAQEETGLDPDGVEVVSLLPQLGVPISGFVVTPVLAWWSEVSPVDVVDVGESERVFRVPVTELIAERNRVSVVVDYKQFRHVSPGFQVADTLVWGFTGILLDEVLDGLGWAVSWDKSRRVSPPP